MSDISIPVDTAFEVYCPSEQCLVSKALDLESGEETWGFVDNFIGRFTMNDCSEIANAREVYPGLWLVIGCAPNNRRPGIEGRCSNNSMDLSEPL